MIVKMFGAPGTGKTTALLKLLEDELQIGTPLPRIAYVTHTVAAKQEARDRAKRKFPAATDPDFIFFRTIHGICFNLTGLAPGNVMQVEDYMEFGNKHGVPFSDSFTGEFDEIGQPEGWMHSLGNEILALRQFAAAHCKDPFDPDIMYSWPENVSPKEMRYVLHSYDKWKRQERKHDFVDMLALYLQPRFAPPDIDVLIIDEAQDLSRIQWQVVAKFMAGAKRIYLAGDDDQSIYSFIGSDPHGFLRHRADKIGVLPHTYRMLQNIWTLAQEIISPIKERKQKDITCRGPGGVVEYWNNDPSYLQLDGNQQTMIIARHHIQLHGIARDLEERGIPFTHRGKSTAGSPRAIALHAYARASKGESIKLTEAVQVMRLTSLKSGAKKLADEARLHPDYSIDRPALTQLGLDFNGSWIDQLSKNAWERRQNELLQQLIRTSGLDALRRQPRIDLTTFHGSKGREADRVVLFPNCFRAAWKYGQLNPDEERRLAYVGVTRARDVLTILAPTSNMSMSSLS